MRIRCHRTIIFAFALVFAGWASAEEPSAVAAREEKITIPTYTWENDINPKFWALESGTKLAARGEAAIVYPYVMQDHISRTKVDRTYKALILENEYLKVTCLPELGGRLHSVLDKTTGKQMFHLNDSIKPGMIAMRGAWISGGVEWNTGPHGHTATVLSPVNAIIGKEKDGSAYLEIGNTEQIFRTQWTVRVTLRPGCSYLDERISIYNPTDGMHPYYFWNCTAFPNGPGTRFIFPMSLGTDHAAKEFFRWPVHEGRDLSQLKNYDMYSSIFAVNCTHDFFGAYDSVADQGIVQAADHRQLGGKKAWTWGEWDFGKTAENNLADGNGHYIEVQSGPLPTQSDYGMLGPHDQISWQEYWYPVHGLGEGFEFANENVAVQTKRQDGKLELRILATSLNPKSRCILKQGKQELCNERTVLSPKTPVVVVVPCSTSEPIEVVIQSEDETVLGNFTTPLPIPKVEPPESVKLAEKPDDQRSVEELYLKGRAFDRATDRKNAKIYYEKSLALDPGHVLSLRSLAVLDIEAGLYEDATKKLQKALTRDSDEGLCWYYLGLCQYKNGKFLDAWDSAYHAVKDRGTREIGHELAGRAAYRLGHENEAQTEFLQRFGKSPDQAAMLRYLIASKEDIIESEINEEQSEIALLILYGLKHEKSISQIASKIRRRLGEADFEILETSLIFADLGLFDEARKIVKAVCVDGVPKAERGFLPLYYLAWYSAQCKDKEASKRWLEEAAATSKDFVFASRVEELDILQYAVKENPTDSQAHLQLGCLLAHLGRVEEAIPPWEKSAELNPKSSIAWRNLGLAAIAKDDSSKAIEYYRKAIAARRSDQTLFRDLATILIASDRRREAIELLETMPHDGPRRAEITMILAESYVAEARYGDCVKLLESALYFVNWEGSDDTWRLFNRAHIERGRQSLEKDDAKSALADFEAALTYPANLNVGRSNKPEEAEAQYWRGKSLAALDRKAEAQAAWKAGAEGFDGVKPSLQPGIPSLKSTQIEFRQKCIDALKEQK